MPAGAAIRETVGRAKDLAGGIAAGRPAFIPSRLVRCGATGILLPSDDPVNLAEET
jgi:hypothetical protein